MNITYSTRQRLIAYFLLISFVLQSCSNFSNPPLSHGEAKAQQNRNCSSPTYIDQYFFEEQENKPFIAQGGHLVTLYQQGKATRAIVKEGLSGRELDLPVYIEEGMAPAKITQLDVKGQQRVVEVSLPKVSQSGYVYIGKRGLMGGMKLSKKDNKSSKTKESQGEISEESEAEIDDGKKEESSEEGESKEEDTTTRFSAVLFDGKLKDTQEEHAVSMGWYDARLITHGTHFYVKDQETYKLHKETSDPVQFGLYKKDPKQSNISSLSHGLVTDKELSLGVSVDTSIHTQTKRKSESKQTNVQYDKGHIRQKSKDFQVDAKRVNSKNKVVDKSNYDGGHLVDHKFSAQGSHTDDYNYVPQHHFYNQRLKENIVKDVSGYLEIPLYTPNPPKIKVIGKNRYDKIPIGILLVTLENKSIQDMYYFPNNQYNYKTAQSKLGINKKGMAKKMGAIFKLKPALHKLLLPALIHDLRAKDANLALQLTHEKKGMATVDNLVEGMSIIGLEDEEDVIATLASDTFHQDGVGLENVLNINEAQLKSITQGQANPAALNQAFNALGQFLVNYAMRNALKSEVLNTHSRIMLANIVTDFIECESEVSGQALDKIDEAYGDTYQEVLEELWKIKDKMSLTDIIYFANLYQTLASDCMHHLYNKRHEVFKGMQVEKSVIKFIEILRGLYNNQAIKEKPDKKQMQNLVSLFIDAQDSLSYIITDVTLEEEFKQQRTFLESAREKVEAWNKLSYSPQVEYQTSPKPNLETYHREANGLSKAKIELLGTNSSCCYENEEDEDESKQEESDEK